MSNDSVDPTKTREYRWKDLRKLVQQRQDFFTHIEEDLAEEKRWTIRIFQMVQELMDGEQNHIAELKEQLAAERCVHAGGDPEDCIRCKLAKAERERDDTRAELIDTLHGVMIRCSEDAAQGYEIPGGGDEIEPECATKCKCPLDCPIYQRWLELTDGRKMQVEQETR